MEAELDSRAKSPREHIEIWMSRLFIIFIGRPLPLIPQALNHTSGLNMAASSTTLPDFSMFSCPHSSGFQLSLHLFMFLMTSADVALNVFYHNYFAKMPSVKVSIASNNAISQNNGYHLF